MPGHVTAYVGGGAAGLVDQKHDLGSRLPLALILIVLTTLLVLWLFTGSVVLPIKALVLNFLSLTAVFGAMVWIFQYGHLSGLLGFTPTPTSTTMPLLLFCIAFGLSMDYEVFVLSRIKELHDAGVDNAEAVAGGLARTGRIVTTAAVLMAVTFFAIATSRVSFHSDVRDRDGARHPARRHLDPGGGGAGLHGSGRRRQLVVTPVPAPAPPPLRSHRHRPWHPATAAVPASRCQPSSLPAQFVASPVRCQPSSLPARSAPAGGIS